ncbi:MAG: hypothetical protein HPY58_13625 [Firmicutes bacterium]|nr:hypothetical protein [Bacillota bacterium]
MAKVSKPGNPEQLIYCGPNIPGGVLQRYTVFKGGLPAHLEELFNKCPAVKLLFVPVTDLARTEKAIATKGTLENAYFNEVLQFISKGGA